jgi:hypothetical protein
VELRATGSPPHALTVKGLLAADQLQIINAASLQGFVAMSFDPGLVAAWTNGFEPAIRAAGYTPLRIDAKDYIGGISDEIMAEIRRFALSLQIILNRRTERTSRPVLLLASA